MLLQSSKISPSALGFGYTSHETLIDDESVRVFCFKYYTLLARIFIEQWISDPFNINVPI